MQEGALIRGGMWSLMDLNALRFLSTSCALCCSSCGGSIGSKFKLTLGSISCGILILTGAGYQAGRAGLGRANSGLGQNWARQKLVRIFRAKILAAQPALKIGLAGPNSVLKAKKLGHVGPGWAIPGRAILGRAKFGPIFFGPTI